MQSPIRRYLAPRALTQNKLTQPAWRQMKLVMSGVNYFQTSSFLTGCPVRRLGLFVRPDPDVSLLQVRLRMAF